MQETELMCKGAWVLNTACGKCSRCLETAPDYIARLQDTIWEQGSQIGRIRRSVEDCADDFSVCERCGDQDNNATRHSNLFLALKSELGITDKLKPCPFCGWKEVDPEGWAGNDGRKGPACDVCGATAETVELWNTRK